MTSALRTSEEAKVLRTIHTSFGRPPRIDNRPPASNLPYPTKRKTTYKPRPNKSCALCLQAGRPDYRSYFLSTCQYLPDSDRQFMARARHVTDIEDTQEYEDNHPDDNYPTSQSNCDCNHPINHRSATCRVNITQSPYLHVFYNQHPLRLTIDTGAETNMIKASLAHYIGCPISKSSQLALQADARTPLSIVGETRLSLSRNGKTLTLEALVVEDLDVDILAGTPFMTCNDIAVRPAKH